MNEDTMDESTDIVNQQTENEKSSLMEPPDPKIEEHKEKNLPEPEIEENVKQGCKRQGCEDIPATAALMLQKRSGNESELKENELSGKNNSHKKDTNETCPKILTEKALSSDIENQQTENKISSLMELPNTKIEEHIEQNLLNPDIEENVEQSRERQCCKDIPAIAALLLQNSCGNKSILKENDFFVKNNSNKNETTCSKILNEKALSSDIANQQTENEISSHKELPDTKIEEQKKQNLPVSEIEQNVEQGREKQGCEDISSTAALMLQKSSGNESELKENELSGNNNSHKKDTNETCPKILTEKALSSDIEKQQTENAILSHMELPDTKIQKQKEQNHPDSDIEENVEQDRERQGCEDIPAIAAFLLQNSISKKSKLKESEFSSKNISDKNVSIESGPKILSKAPTNGLPINQEEGKVTMKGSPLPDPELENSNSCQEKILSNSKDSSMLSTTDTQDEIETIDNGDQIYINDLDDQAEIAAQSNLAKQQLLDMSNSDDSLDGMMGSDFDHHTEETFSIVSGSEYDEASQSSTQEKHFDNPVQDIDKPTEENGNDKSKLIEIEIETKKIIDDNNSSLTNDKNKTGQSNKNGNSVKPELRRSSRTVKQRKYSYDEHNDEDSEMDERDSEDTLKIKSRPILINDTKSLVEIAARQAARSTASDRREPQLVLIGSKPKQAASAPTHKNTSSSLHSSLYQSIVARGTTVTPVPSKPTATTTSQAVQTSPTPTPVLLPSLTDDMFVVEAPSFIVPYVYEKPSVKPFKEFVTELGKDIEEKRAKAEKELLEKKLEEKLKRQERIDQGEEVIDSGDEARRENEKKIKIAKKEKRRHRQEEDESSWDGWDSSDSDDFKITDDSGTTVVIDGKDELVEDIKKSERVPAAPSNSNSYFDGSLGKFFTNIGMSLVEEYVQRDLLKTQQRKLQREKKAGHSTKQSELVKSISLLMKNYEISKQNNKPLKCVQIKCEYCTFETESEIVLAQHMETPHMKNNMYKCNFCKFEIRNPHDILFHMEAEHNVRGRLERAPAYHQCVNCPFEDNGKGKLARHVIACAKKFKPEYNLSPPADWEPPAKIPKVAKGRQTMLGAPIPMSGPFGRPQPSMNPFSRPPISNMLPNTSTSNYRPRARVPGQIMMRPVIAGGSIVRGCSIQQQNATAAQAAAIAKKNHPSISITPVPPRPVLPALPPHESATATFVICEICDGYIKDLEQLRNHMQWIHRVKIHPKMIYNRPPLNCQKCQFRFFTDMGLERHLLGSHGLVTSSMQDAANKNKDAGRCPVCGKVFQWKLLNHMAKDHGMTLKPAHLSYKCTVCSATFEMYKLFENHVYSAHSVVAKRVMDKVPVKGKSNNIPKGLKINDEITITAQPARPSKEK